MSAMRRYHMPISFRTASMLSVAVHVCIALLIVAVQWANPLPDATVTYYVDLANLPVASPMSGSAVQGGADTESPTPKSLPVPPPAVPAHPTTMKAPSKESSSSFEERMQAIRSKAEQRQMEQDANRQAAITEALRQRVAARGKKGTPGGTGTEVGSDYTAYLQSRFKDAFEVTISFQSKTPYVVMVVFVDAQGRITRARIDKSSGDRVFELSVQRAITMAERTITPPPGRTGYEGVFMFKPQGVTVR